MRFNKIEYPTCPYCLTLLNDDAIFSLKDLTSPYFHLKTCPIPSCGEKFLMSVRTELAVEAVPVEDL